MKIKISSTKYVILSFSASSEELNQFEEVKHFKTNKIDNSEMIPIYIFAFGLPSIYSDKQFENFQKHLPCVNDLKSKKVYYEVFQSIFKNYFNENVFQMSICHGHTEKMGKCYIQIFFYLPSSFQKAILPGHFIIEDESEPLLKDFVFVFMNQRPIIISKEEEKNKKLENDEIYNNDNLTLLRYDEPPSYVSTIPDYWIINTTIFAKYPLIKKWFYKYALPIGLKKRKSLLLYSSRRQMGKAEFSKGLVSNESNYFIFDKNFDIIPENQNPKLIIAKNFSSFKPLKKTKNDFYFSGDIIYPWDYELPCIIISSNLKFVLDCFYSPKTNSCIIFQEITESMTYSGLFDSDFQEIEGDFTDSAKFDLENETKIKKKYNFLNKKSKFNSSFILSEQKNNDNISYINA